MQYLQRSSSTIVRSFITYEPLRFFLIPSSLLLTSTFVIGIRYLYFWVIGEGRGHIQSLILALALFMLGTALLTVGLLSDLIAVNRQLLEGIDFRLRRLELTNLGEIDSSETVYNRAILTYKKKIN